MANATPHSSPKILRIQRQTGIEKKMQTTMGVSPPPKANGSLGWLTFPVSVSLSHHLTVGIRDLLHTTLVFTNGQNAILA